MANEKHLLLTAQGDYTDSALVEETWQVGLRLALVFGTVDDVGTLPSNWDPVAHTISRTLSDCTITGNWTVPVGVNTFAPDDFLYDIVKYSFETWFGAFPAISTATRLKTLKLSPIGTDGKAVPAPPYTQGSPVVLSYTSSYPVGTNAGTLLPLQNALVMSHRTPQIGRRGRGRMFVPGLTTGLLDTHAKVASGVVSSALTAQEQLLHNLTWSGGGPGTDHVRPIVTGKPFTHYGAITEVRCGNVSDTQRRRRRSLTETVSSLPVT
jgi:hypothetical protein